MFRATGHVWWMSWNARFAPAANHQTRPTLQVVHASASRSCINLPASVSHTVTPLAHILTFRLSPALPAPLLQITRCNKRFAHDWRSCPYAHPTENARRRDPREFRYCALACPDYKQVTVGGRGPARGGGNYLYCTRIYKQVRGECAGE